MTSNVFPQEIVGDYFNEHFVCLKVDMEKGEGRAIQQKYRVSAYPTFLILDTDGNLVHAVVGGMATGDEFLAKVKIAFDENSAGKLGVEYEMGIGIWIS